ncbi:MAG: ABC transporter ATP-binding protein [Saprospiraceae bacterium]|nr:ABC transporter ATP-binding protein [Saprospiraceae bacterium]
MKELWSLNKYFVRYKWRFLAGIVFVLLMNYFRIVQPQMIRDALDLVVNQLKDPVPGAAEVMAPKLVRFGLIVFGCAVLMGIFMYFMRQSIIVMSRLIEYDLKKNIYDHYSALDQTFYRKQTTGDLMSRITEDVSKVRMYLGPAVLYAIDLAALIILVVVSMVKVDLTLSLLTLLPLPFLSVSIFYVSSIINRKSTAIQQQLSKLTSIAQEVYSGIRIVKSYTQEKTMGNYFAEEAEKYKYSTLDLSKVNALFFPLIMLLTGLSTVIIVWAGVYRVQSGAVTPGNIAEFVIYINMLTWPVTAIGWLASIVQQAEASMKRINEFMTIQPVIDRGGDLKPDKISGKIEFKNVSFIYPNTGTKALDNLSFTIPPGSRLAIIGKTASGKTTIAELMLRLFDVTSGEILLDGVNIKEYDISVLRKKIGYVPQDQFLFSESIRNNIRLGEPLIEDIMIDQSAVHAAIADEIERLPDKMQTILGERGVTLSGGQKQRVAIARALAKNPEILILDDCLSAVDTRTEKAIVGAFNQVLADKTTILITHRINHLLGFDRILVLHKGQLAETGTHEQLLEKQGVYFKLLERQKWEESHSPGQVQVF